MEQTSPPTYAPAGIAGLDARRAALDILERIRRGEPLDEALEHCRAFALLEGSDRGLAHSLAT
ncbi:MAG: hypothetical protein ACX939_14330, partial [Hyphococcus sp.]